MTQKMKKSFNPKNYQGKLRIYAAVPSETKISRLWIWDEKAKEYRTPPTGKCYLTNRYVETAEGNRKRIFRFFETLEETRRRHRRMEETLLPAH